MSEAALTALPEATPMSYYGRPVIKPPSWRWYIAAYLFVGGMAGASGTLALAARLTRNAPLARGALGGAVAGVLISPVLLIADLHDPKRFLNMLRMVKVTSPMSVGSWILTAFGASVTTAAAAEFLEVAPLTGRAAGVAAGVLGPALSTYTAALIANTAVPVWHDAYGELPFVFAGGSIVSAGAWALLTTPVAAAAPARRAIVAGALLEFSALELMTRRLGRLVGEPYRRGIAGRLKTAARVTTLGALALLPAARTGRAAAAVAGLLGLAGALSERFSIFEAGKASARDPKYTVGPQRARRKRVSE